MVVCRQRALNEGAALQFFLTRPTEDAEGRRLVTFTLMPGVEPSSTLDATE